MGKLVDQLAGYRGDDRHQLIDDENRLKPGGGPVPTPAELEQTYVAPGRKAQLPIGITYQAHWKMEADGMARHARQQVRALATTGLPIRLQSFGQHVVLDSDLEPSVRRVAYLEGVSCSATAFAIKQLVFDTPTLLREVICPAAVRSQDPGAVKRISECTIIYTSWERDRVHPQFIELLNTAGQVWVPCAANWNAFRDSGLPEEKLRVVPYPYDPEEHTIAAPRGSDQVPSGKRFYAISKWEPRKNQHQLIGAFLIGFKPTERASLLIKTSGFGLRWSNYPEVDESIAHWLADERVKANGWNEQQVDRLVRIVAERIPATELETIHSMNNIYVSAGLGEAWDIPAFEAKLAGNRLVYVGYGGPEMYRQDLDDVAVEWKGMQPVHAGYLWEPDAQWAKVTTEALAAAMRKAEPPEERVVPPWMYRNYSMVSVGRQMFSHLKELAQKHGCWEQLIEAGGFG